MANKNTPMLLPVVMENLSDLLIVLFKTQLEESGVTLKQEAWDKLLNIHQKQMKEKESIKSQMYVLTNKYKTWGAVAFLYPGVLKTAAEQFGKDLIILPSSVHEVILIPQDNITEFRDLSEMVKNINIMMYYRKKFFRILYIGTAGRMIHSIEQPGTQKMAVENAFVE